MYVVSIEKGEGCKICIGM